MAGITLDYDVADGIVIAVLKEQLQYLKKELKQHKKGKYMHPEDVYSSEYELIPALELIIKHFGG